MRTTDVAVIGGGIVGLSTAYQLIKRYPGVKVTILEKEEEICRHQTGHNSGVIHSGLYYRPGSIKADHCARGREALIRFAVKHRIPHEICGKVLAATRVQELIHLDRIEQTGRANGLKGLKRIDNTQIREIEPHCHGIAGLFVPQTGIIDYAVVGRTLRREIENLGKKAGSGVLCGWEVRDLRVEAGGVILETGREPVRARFLIACAGLQSDRLAAKDGLTPDLRIVPFRGDYYELVPGSEYRVRNLIYPVPDPDLPFLGVHFTRMIGGGVEAGPSAVFSFMREGYDKLDFSLRDTLESLAFRGTWRLFMRHWRYGLGEYSRAFSKTLFLNALKRLVPDLNACEIKPSRSGIRAQALNRRGELLDDFCIESTDHSIHVLNAPSPAATASLAIADTVVDMASRRFDFSRRAMIKQGGF